MTSELQGTSTPAVASTDAAVSGPSTLSNSDGSDSLSASDNSTLTSDEIFRIVRGWSPRATIRVDFYRDHRYTPKRIPDEPPNTPWALYLTDRSGRFHLLGLDFDDRPGTPTGAARRAAEQVSRKLHQLDVPHLLCASGGRNGRHLWIRLTSPVESLQVRRLANALTTRYGKVFDATPLRNSTSGCVRAPGSPHRFGGHSQALRTAGRPAARALEWANEGADPSAVDALLEWARPATGPTGNDDRSNPRNVTVTKQLRVIDHQLGMIPGATRPLPEHIQRLAQANPAPYADTSRIAWSIMLSAAHAHWSLEDITRAATVTRLPGLEHLRSAPTPNGHRAPRTDPKEHTARQWHRALTAAAAAPPPPEDTPTSHARQHVRAALTAAEQHPFFRGSPQAFRRWAALAAIADLMYRADTIDDFELDVRRWAIAAGTTKSVLAITVRELMDTGWLIRTRQHAGTKAAAYRLCIPAVHVRGHKVSHPPEAPPEQAFDRARNYLSHLNRDVWQHSSLGPSTAIVHWWMCHSPTLRQEGLQAATGLTRRHLDTAIRVLETHRLVRHGQAIDRERIYRGVATFLGVDGILERRRTRYRHESLVWAWWCAEVTWRSAPASAKPALSVRHTYGQFPTLADGSCDWASAMHRVARVEALRTKAQSA